jgi:hypothetical protein
MLLGRKHSFRILQLRGGGVPSATPRWPVDSTTKKFAEKQMMVVRFDTDHTDSGFQKVWSGM